MDSARLESMRQARQQQAEHERRRLAAHAEIAARLRAGDHVDEILAAALAQIELWQRGRLCSRDYIDAWHEIITGGPIRTAEVLEEFSPFGVRMRQNTPFANHLKQVA